MAAIKDTDGNDTLTGTSGADTFTVAKGGEDTVSGLGGNDVVSMYGTFDAGDRIDGGDGSDQLWLRGDYSAGVTLTDATLTNVERIALGVGDSYTLTTSDGNVTAGATLTVDGSKLGAGNVLDFDGSAETDGHFDLIAGAGNDVLKGGNGGDTFDLRHGTGQDSITGGSGNDLILAGAYLGTGDAIDGGGGANNVMRFEGDYSAGLTLSSANVKNIQTLQFDNANYDITAGATAFAPGAQVFVTASTLNDSHSLTFDASASSASFKFVAGAGNDVLTGGAAADNFDLSAGGSDTVAGGAGNDLFTVGAAFTPADQIDGGVGADRLEINGDLTMTFRATTMVNVETLILDAGQQLRADDQRRDGGGGPNAALVRGARTSVQATALPSTAMPRPMATSSSAAARATTGCPAGRCPTRSTSPPAATTSSRAMRATIRSALAAPSPRPIASMAARVTTRCSLTATIPPGSPWARPRSPASRPSRSAKATATTSPPTTATSPPAPR